MSIRLVYGRSGTGKSSYIFKKIKEEIDNGRKKYIITPEQFSFTAEKKLLNDECVDEKEQGVISDAVINAEVLTFARMAHRVAGEVGGSAKTKLSNCGKSMLIYSILSNKKNDLKFLGKSDSNIDMIMTQLTELKKHGVTLENLQNLKEQVAKDDRYLESKLNDIYTVYSKFQEKISENYIDENDVLTILAEQLDSTNMFKNTEIYIDEFVGFTKQEYMVIEKLLEQAYSVTITVNTDCLEITKDASNDIFYTNKETVQKLMKLAKSVKVKIEEPVCMHENGKVPYRFKAPELAHVERNLYNFPYRKYEKEIKDMHLFLANNPYSEIEEVARRIVELVQNSGYRYKDIAVITKNIDTYSSLCRAIFNEYNIPVYIDEKRDLSQNILVKYLISILDVFARNWSYDSMINYLKSGFVNIAEDDIYELENYALKWEVKGNKWYKEDWNFKDADEVGKEFVNHVNQIRRTVVTPLVRLKANLSGTKTAKQISENLYNFFLENKIDKILEDKINLLNEEEKVNISAEYETSWKIVMQVLDEIVLVFGNENVTFDSYMQILKTGLKESKLGTIPMAQDQVTVGDVDRSRSHKVNAIFIIGLNDGVFPSQNKAEGFLNDDDRAKIKENGVELAKGTIDRIYEDNFNIYKAFTTAEKEMYLSYSSSDMEGESLRPSILVSRIKKIFPGLEEKSDVVNRISEVSTKQNTFEELLNNLRDFRDGKEINPKWFYIYNVYSSDAEWSQKLDASIKALDYVNTPEKISRKNIEKMYGETLKTSVSRLEQYSSCPFSYYLTYGLKLNDKETFKVETMDTGSFMHDVIDNFFETLEEKEINIKEITDEEIEEIVAEVVQERLAQNRNYIFSANAKYKVLTARLQKVVTMSIKYIVQTLKQSEFSVFGHEVEFGGNSSEFEPIVVKTEDGTRVEIRGKIDRIDIMKNPDGTFVRIIDYKSSVKNIDLNQVFSGLQLQLLTYLNEICKIEDFIPAGVLYFNLLDKPASLDKHLSDEEIEAKIRQEFKMKGLILADVNIIKKMDTNIENEPKGISKIIPATIKKDGELSSKGTSAVTKEQFEYLQKYTEKIIKQISEQILGGNIDVKPFYNTSNKRTPCEYCKYKSICRFDENACANSYNYISNKNKEAVLETIKERTKE